MILELVAVRGCLQEYKNTKFEKKKNTKRFSKPAGAGGENLFTWEGKL